MISSVCLEVLQEHLGMLTTVPTAKICGDGVDIIIFADNVTERIDKKWQYKNTEGKKNPKENVKDWV